MLEAVKVNFSYDKYNPIIEDMDLKIEDGEFVALLGHNGSGKTTLSRLFMALCHPRSGKVLVDGEDIIKLEPADLADRIGYVFQNPDLQILEDTVLEEVCYGGKAKKLPKEVILKQAEIALKAMGLWELRNAYPRLLSFGEKRRLGVAAALALNPKMLILDEITNGQDALEQENMMQYLKAINEEKGITILLISHDMDSVLRYAKRTVVLKQGQLVFDGSPKELFAGHKPVEAWGLSCPVISLLGNALGIEAAYPEELCAKVTVKEAE